MNHYKRLTREQRYTIKSLSRQPCSQEFIACTIGVHSSTVGRELGRAGMNRETYCHLTAQKDADSREWAGRTLAPELLLAFETKLCAEQWSPEQISGTFRKQGVGRVSHESIYQHIYRDKRAGGKLIPHQVKRVETLLNSRPRKCLAYQTPHDIFHPPRPLALAA